MMRQIKGFPNYLIDEYGNVYNQKTKRFLKQCSSTGYSKVGLFNKGKMKIVSVHRLVAEAFIPNPDNLPCINHKDENKLNNFVENLEWCTHSYNNHYGVGKPTDRAIDARKIPVEQYSLDGELIAEFESACEAGRKTGIHQSNISKCCLKRPNFKTAGGFVWKFKSNKVR